MKKILLALVLIPSLAIGAGWDETITSPAPDDTIMINDVSQPEGSKTQYTSLQRLPISTRTGNALDQKVNNTGDETIQGAKNFAANPIVPEPTQSSHAATKNYVDINAGGGGGVWGLITGTLSDQGDLWTALLGKVNNTGSESINGEKTFLISPIVPTPTTGLQAVTKDYADTKVDTTGNQTVDGVKTFNASPIVPTPTTDFQAATKEYVDGSNVVDNSRFGTLAIASDHTVTDQEIKDNTIISNYGAAGTVLATLPDVAYSWKATLTTEANNVLRVCPPSGQSIKLDGVDLSADTCVESEATNGRMASLLHTRDSTGDMYYSLISALGDWTAQETGPISLDTGHALGDMVACYILEETDETGLGTSILDLTTNNYDLTLTETSAQGYTREAGGGVYFEEAGEGVAQGFAIPITADGFTIVAVMKTSSVGGAALRPVNLAGSTFSVDMVGVGTAVSTTYITQQTLNDGNWRFSDGTTELGLDSVHAIAGVFTDGSDRELYLDGASESTDTTVTTIQYTNLDSICIGAMCDSTPIYTTGTVYAGYIFDRILSPAEAASITADPYQMINNYSGPQ